MNIFNLGDLGLIAIQFAEVGIRVVRCREVVTLELYGCEWEQILLEA